MQFSDLSAVSALDEVGIVLRELTCKNIRQGQDILSGIGDLHTCRRTADTQVEKLKTDAHDLDLVRIILEIGDGVVPLISARIVSAFIHVPKSVRFRNSAPHPWMRAGH